LNVYSLATFIFDLVLGLKIAAVSSPPTSPAASNAWIYTCVATSYFCY